MVFVKCLIAVIIVLVILVLVIKFLTRNTDSDDDDIISEGRSLGSKFNDCCIKKIKGMFGGGA